MLWNQLQTRVPHLHDAYVEKYFYCSFAILCGVGFGFGLERNRSSLPMAIPMSLLTTEVGFQFVATAAAEKDKKKEKIIEKKSWMKKFLF